MPRPTMPADAVGSADPAPPVEARLRAVEDLADLAPDLGWAEASGVAEALLDAISHRMADAATGQPEPRPLPPVVGAIGGTDRAPDHAACRAASARLRALAPLLVDDPRSWARDGAAVMVELGDLLDHLAERTRLGALTLSDKAVVLRRLHAWQRRLRA